MTCHRCHQTVPAVFGGGANIGIADGEVWCADCCDSAGVIIPASLRHSTPSASLNPIRAAWLADKEHQTRERNTRRIEYFKAHGRWPREEEIADVCKSGAELSRRASAASPESAASAEARAISKEKIDAE